MKSLRRWLARGIIAALAAGTLAVAPWAATPASAGGLVCLEVGGKPPSIPDTSVYIAGLYFKSGCQYFKGNQNAVLIVEGSISDIVICTVLTKEMTGSASPEPGWFYHSYGDYEQCRAVKGQPESVNGAFLSCPGCPKISAIVNAASYGASATLPAGQSRPGFAPEGLAVAFGENLASSQETAPDTSCRNILAGRQIRAVPYNGGASRTACLTYVGPGQINFYINDRTFPVHKEKEGTIQLLDASGKLLTERRVPIRRISPGIFTQNSSGTGLPSGYLIRVRGEEQTIEPVTSTIRLNGDKVYLILYVTGIRNHDTTKGYSVVFRNSYQQHYAGIEWFGPAPGFPAVDQINLVLPHQISGPLQYYLSFFDPNSAPDHGVWSQILNITLEY